MSEGETHHLSSEREGATAWPVLDRPAKNNAISNEMLAAIERALARLLWTRCETKGRFEPRASSLASWATSASMMPSSTRRRARPESGVSVAMGTRSAR